MARATLKRRCPVLGSICLESDCAWFLGESNKGDCAIHVLGVRHKIQLDDIKENNHLNRLAASLDSRSRKETKKEISDVSDFVWEEDGDGISR